MKEAAEGDGRTVGVVIGRLGGVAEGLRAAVEEAAGRGGCGGDGYDGEQADKVLPGGEEAGRGLGGGREGGPGGPPRRTRRHLHALSPVRSTTARRGGGERVPSISGASPAKLSPYKEGLRRPARCRRFDC